MIFPAPTSLPQMQIISSSHNLWGGGEGGGGGGVDMRPQIYLIGGVLINRLELLKYGKKRVCVSHLNCNRNILIFVCTVKLLNSLLCFFCVRIALISNGKQLISLIKCNKL